MFSQQQQWLEWSVWHSPRIEIELEVALLGMVTLPVCHFQVQRRGALASQKSEASQLLHHECNSPPMQGSSIQHATPVNPRSEYNPMFVCLAHFLFQVRAISMMSPWKGIINLNVGLTFLKSNEFPSSKKWF